MRKLLQNKGLIRGVWQGRFPPAMRREIQRERENGGGFGAENEKSLFLIVLSKMFCGNGLQNPYRRSNAPRKGKNLKKISFAWNRAENFLA